MFRRLASEPTRYAIGMGRVCAVRRRVIAGAAAVAAASLVACSSSPATSAPTSPKSPVTLTNVSLEIPNPGASFLPFYLGKAEGIYKKYGINLTIDDTIAPPLAVQSILGGSLDFMAAIGTAGSAGIEGRPMRVYDVVADGIDFVMIGGKGVTKMSQLRGATIVGESAVSQTNLMETLMLEHAGVPVSSVHFVNITGGDAARSALVQAGKAQAVSVEITGAIPLEHQGYRIISNTNFVLEPFTGLATSTSFASSHKQLMQNMVDATTQATKIVKTNEPETVKVLEQAPLSLSKSNAEAVWKYMQTEWISSPKPSTKAINNQLAAWVAQYKLSSTPAADEAFDWTYADKF
jgi:ABC-type nitrate/sulfonate/bicarbonate transport system substrate-binding protein